jgi:ERCC4-type nuclease
MVIIQDTREQSPLEFNHELVERVDVMKLDVGDYACRFKNGYVPFVRFERKSIGDLFGTLGKGHDRFKREIVRAAMYEVRLILIIEGTLTKVLKGYEYSNMPGATIIKIIFSLWERYNMYPVFCKNKDECSRYIVEFFAAMGRKALRDMKVGKHDAKQ